jgi:hypothetical protein
MRGELLCAVERVDGHHQPLDIEMMAKHGVIGDREHDRGRIREPAGLDHHAA